MIKYIIVVSMAVILVLAGGYYFIIEKNMITPAQVQNQQPAPVATTTYATSSFSVVYPADFTLDPAFLNTSVVPTKPIAGVKLTIPGTMATGTNLSSDTYISIEQLPRAKNCTGDIYLADNVTPNTVTDGAVTYSVATTSGAGLGNFYEEQVYAIAGSQPCTAVRYLIHSMNIGNFDPSMNIREFDRAVLIGAFDAIRRSVTLTAPQI